MLERIPESPERPELSLHSLFSIGSLERAYLQQLCFQDAAKAGELLEETNARLAKTLETSARMADMIQHFRALENPASGSMNLRTRTVHDSVHQVLRAMHYEFPLEKATVLKILPHDLGPLPIPREMLETVIFQLVLNARESLGEVSGIITIEAAEKTFLSPENRGPGRFVLRVSDTGPGIPEEYLENLFDPFYATRHVHRLNAIGLCLVKKIVEYYEGLMRIETSLIGTSYFIELPRN